MKLREIVGQGVAAAAVVVAVTLLSRGIVANAVTAGFIYLVAILGLAVWRGFLAGTIGSLLATACLNFYFFPPLGTFHIADQENWVALASFLAATTVASRLVVRERQRAAEAESRQREIAALYDLCVDLFTAGAKPGGLDAAVSRALRTIGAQGGGLILHQEGTDDDAANGWVGGARDLEVHRLLDHRPAGARREMEFPSNGWRNVRIPVVIGSRVAGHLVAYGTHANQATLESVVRLVGLAFEREHLLAEQARLEGLQASDSLKSSLLRAVSHDLTTPLTAILLSLESLKREVANRSEGVRAVERLEEEASRLNRRIQNLLSMARLEAGGFVPRREPTPAADLFRAARENLRPITSSTRIEAHVEPGCPDLDVDPSLGLEILVNLIENAHRASPSAAPIELVAASHPTDPSRVRLEVRDRGRGLAGGSLAGGTMPLGPAASAGDVPGKGLGLEIARSFAAAHGGSIEHLPREGGGVCARIDLPAARAASSDISEAP